MPSLSPKGESPRATIKHQLAAIFTDEMDRRGIDANPLLMQQLVYDFLSAPWVRLVLRGLDHAEVDSAVRCQPPYEPFSREWRQP